MQLFILNLLENIFILWFVLVCSDIDIHEKLYKFIILTLLSSFSVIYIQDLQILKNVETNLIITMILGILFYTLMLKMFYLYEIKIKNCLIYLLIFFVVFILFLKITLMSFYNLSIGVKDLFNGVVIYGDEKIE